MRLDTWRASFKASEEQTIFGLMHYAITPCSEKFVQTWLDSLFLMLGWIKIFIWLLSEGLKNEMSSMSRHKIRVLHLSL